MTRSIERATEADVPRVLALSNAGMDSPANLGTEPEALSDWVLAWKTTHAMHPWLVAREADGVVGFAKASPHRSRGGYRWTAKVSVYVDRAVHGRRVGTALYAVLIPTLRAQGYVTLLAGITVPNAPSERLHEATGFTRCATYHRAGWKLGAWRDVGYWEMHLQGDEAPGAILPVDAVWTGR